VYATLNDTIEWLHFEDFIYILLLYETFQNENRQFLIIRQNATYNFDEAEPLAYKISSFFHQKI
jgi:hypothetical protein